MSAPKAHPLRANAPRPASPGPAGAARVVVVQRVLEVVYSLVDEDGEGVATQRYLFPLASLRDEDALAAVAEARAKRADLEQQLRASTNGDGGA